MIYPNYNTLQQPSYYQQSYNNLNSIYNQQNSQLPGRVVNSFDEITAAEVPMNGSVATFVKADLSEVQTVFWNQEGKIVPCTYVRSETNDSEKNVVDITSINNDIKMLIEKVENIEQFISKPKEEVAVNE